MADSILTKIAERDGELTKDTVIDWDKETWEYIATEIPELKNATEDLKEFLSMPMKDLMNGVEITKVINLNVDKDLQSKMKQLHKPKELQVYTFSPFGYEGALVQVETDLRRGIPAYDIVGISDGIIKETRERIRAAFNNSGLDFPSERVLQSLSPADLKKDSPLDLSMALDILEKTQNYPVDGPVLALGELELSGEIRPVRGAVAAVNSAFACGITNIICDPTTAELLKDIHGIKILAVENLKEAHEKLQEINSFKLTEPHIVNKNHVEFVESDYIKESLENLSMDGHFETVRAIEVAVAGKHNILTTGAPGLTQEHINAAEKERNRIIEPILNGERTGMYKAFKEFEEKGVFDIKGKNVTLAKNGGLTPTGWKQLQAAMEIYRNKKFETFRYIMIDRKTGEIADQLAITSHMPNFCSVSKPNDETLKQVITRAEEKDYLIAVCHNHPSGNTTESSFDRDVTNSLDRSLRNSDGLNRFAGHIILDHNTFNLAVPSEKTPGKCHWKKMDVLNVTEIDPLKEPLSKNPDFKLDDYNIISSSVLISVAQQINDTDNWNDNFVPVVFTNADRGISGVQYYSKNFFENDSNKIRNEFQLTAKEAGAIGAFPVITDNLWNKIPAENRSDFEARMKTHVMNDAFTDVAIDKTTITEKYGIEAGRNYYSLQHEQKDRQVDVDSTWEPSVNSLLFPPEGVGEVDKSNDYKTSPKIKELYLKESKVNIFKDSFIQKEKFVPAIFKNNDKDYIIRVSGNDLINEKYNSINTIYIHMNKNQLQNVLKFHLNNEWNRILDNPASEIKLKIRNPKTLSSNQKELFISKGITDEIKMQKLYADIHKEILFDENNPIVVSKRNFVKQKQIERHNEIQNKKNEFDTDFGY